MLARAFKLLSRVKQGVEASRERGTLQDDARVAGGFARAWGRQAADIVSKEAGSLMEGGIPSPATVKKAVERSRERVWQARRMARREAEQREAFAIFARLENTWVGHRAQAVVVLKYLEWEAERALAALPANRRAELEAIARAMKNAGLETSKHTQGDTNCGQCVRKLAPELKGGDCCSGMVFLAFDPLDAAFRVLLGEFAPLVRKFEGDVTRCGFLDGDGCRLTPGTRPTVCTSYYCGPYRQDLEQDKRWDGLSAVLQDLNSQRSSLAFRLNLAKRFSLGENTHADATHPFDFIWERLRARGADLTAKDTLATGVNSKLKIVS